MLMDFSFCMGGSTAIKLLASPNNYFSSAVICHPGPEGRGYYDKFTVPTRWVLASSDMRFKQPAVDEVKASLSGKPMDFTLDIYPGE